MSTRYVTNVTRNKAGAIVAVCHPGEPWSPQTKDKAIADIAAGEEYFTVAAKVKVVHGPHGDYLRTVPDRTNVDNLGRLPKCPPAKGRCRPGENPG